MIFDQYYLDCLSQASYLVGDESSGRAVVVDPRRDVGEYLADAEAKGLSIELVIETHFHADFLSGHLELSAATGAEVAYSSVASPDFDFRAMQDGERVSLGEVVLEFRHTPGHTPESMSIVVWEHADDAEPHAVLTGDTLFIGDVGRPDLLSSVGFSQDDLASQLYDSLHGQLMVLPDATKVFPGHGAGSACGKNLSTDTWSTIGEQRRTNYAVKAPDKETFIELVTEGQATAPGYFLYDAGLNKSEHGLLDETEPTVALSWAEAQAAMEAGAVLLDGRDPEDFARGYLEGSINVGLNGRYAEFAGSIVPVDMDIVVVVEPGAELEAKNRLARIGFDRVLGHVEAPYGVMQSNPEDAGIASRLTAEQLVDRLAQDDSVQLVDVRGPGECESAGVIDGALNMPVATVRSQLDDLNPDLPTVVYCAGGYRSSVVASMLRAEGFADVSDLIGGFGAWAPAVACVS